MALPSSDKPLFGLWEPENHLKYLYYGTGCVEQQLLSVLPSPSSKVFIVTGNSIATKTTLVKHLKVLLADHIAGVFPNVKQHVHAAGLDEATAMIKRCNPPADTILAVGGGSPIDFAKVLSYRLLEKRDKPITLIAIPTTLSAAECTAGGGFTKADGTKTGFLSSSMGINAIFYDPDYAKYTPKRLWLGTGIRAIDHAVETMYHPYAVEFPRKALSIWALETLFECLPKAQVSHPADKDLTTRLLLAAFASSAMKGSNVRGGPGLSHALGYALGSPYDIPRK
jgi:alcohol dehydrogenase class IV